MQQNSETWTTGESFAQSHNIIEEGGFLKLPVVLENRSNVAFRVTNMLLAATFVNGEGPVLPVQNLVIDQGTLNNFQPFSLGPGESTGVVNFVSLELTLETTRLLLANADALQIRLGLYELSDATNKSLSFIIPEVDAKTATVVIDYGSSRTPEMYQVATNLDPVRQGITATRAFRDILKIPYIVDGTSLTAIRDAASDASGGTQWKVTRLHREGSGVVTTTYGDDGGPVDFDSLELRAGDVLHLEFIGPGSPPAPQPGPPPFAKGPPFIDGGLRVLGVQGTDQ
jgi:hypothetical protein